MLYAAHTQLSAYTSRSKGGPFSRLAQYIMHPTRRSVILVAFVLIYSSVIVYMFYSEPQKLEHKIDLQVEHWYDKALDAPHDAPPKNVKPWKHGDKGKSPGSKDPHRKVEWEEGSKTKEQTTPQGPNLDTTTSHVVEESASHGRHEEKVSYEDKENMKFIKQVQSLYLWPLFFRRNEC
jgi:hypothetical protein